MKLTFETIKARTALHPTRSAFRRKDGSAFASAKNQDFLDLLYPTPMQTSQPLTVDQIKTRAAQSKSRTDFKRKHDHTYRRAAQLGLLDTLFPPKQPTPKPEPKPRPKAQPKERTSRRITEQLVRETAARYEKRYHFENADPTLYNWALKHGLMQELFGEKQCACGSTADFIEKAKAVHGDRYDYSEVKYERRNKKVKIVCREHGEFWQRPASHLDGRGCAKCWSFDNDAIYIKQLREEFFNGLPIYKVGVTSSRLGLARLIQQDKSSGLRHKILVYPTAVIGRATEIEGFALSLGADPKLSPFDGSTEYRAYEDHELNQVLEMIELCKN